MPGVARALPLLFAERCLMNQEVGALCRIDRRRARSRIASECNQTSRTRRAYQVGRSDRLTVGQLHCLTFRELAPQRALGNPERACLLDVAPAATLMLFDDVADRGTAAMLGRECMDVVAIPRRRAFHSIAGLHFGDFDGEWNSLDAELHRGAQYLLRSFGAVQKQRLRPPLQTERPDQSDDTEKMIGVKGGEKDFRQRKAHPVAHHLALRAFPTLEEQRLALAMNGEAGDVALDGGPGGRRAEECYGEHGWRI